MYAGLFGICTGCMDARIVESLSGSCRIDAFYIGALIGGIFVSSQACTVALLHIQPLESTFLGEKARTSQ
jgi:hypothetical protein